MRIKQIFLALLTFFIIVSCNGTEKLILAVNKKIAALNEKRNPGEDIIESVKSIERKDNRYHCYDEKKEQVVVLEAGQGILAGEIKVNYCYIYDEGEEWGIITHKIEINSQDLE